MRRTATAGIPTRSLFFDPIESRVIDYVGGQEDLRQGVVRAIGDPRERIAEDKLRMLRAVRFAARFDFALDERTLTAIQEQAHELVIVSAERIAAEMRQILANPNRARGVQMLQAARLLEVVLPEIALEADAAYLAPAKSAYFRRGAGGSAAGACR
jgi:poly(A) polymerase